MKRDILVENANNGFEILFVDVLSNTPIRAKSLIMTIFGDAVVPRGGRIWLGALVSLAKGFCLQETLIRASALRLSNEKWLLRRQKGKLSYYSMSEGYSVANITFQKHIYSSSEILQKNGCTILRTFTDNLDRSQSYALNNTLKRFGFGQLAPHVYIHTSLGPQAVHHILASGSQNGAAGVAFKASLYEQEQESTQKTGALAWNMEELLSSYEEFIATFEPLLNLLETGQPEPETAFKLRILIIHCFRRLALRDPRLPKEMYVADWPGDTAYKLVGTIYRKLLASSEAHLDTMITAEDGGVPVAQKSLYERFVEV
ncbi:MAG: hypothetical protein K8F25_11970 [Fimbriimonadaceae bacterium]|nr:hypothetical protein [Alphaproteobacteria bacterium]